MKIPIINDKVYELDETFQLEISIPEEVFAAGVIHGCHPIAPSITVDIFDDDGKFTMYIHTVLIITRDCEIFNFKQEK